MPAPRVPLPRNSQTWTVDPRTDSWWYRPPTVPAGIREIQCRQPDDYDFARLVWQVCDDCQTGVILKVRVTGPWQRHGYATRMVHHSLRGREQYAWSTTPQFEDGRAFFLTITSVPLLGRFEQCHHMDAGHAGRMHSWEPVDVP